MRSNKKRAVNKIGEKCALRDGHGLKRQQFMKRI